MFNLTSYTHRALNHCSTMNMRNNIVILLCHCRKLSAVAVSPLHCGIEQVRVHGGGCGAITFVGFH